MGNTARTFEDTEAKRERVPLMVGLVGPSGGGKTFSALRLATGIQRVTGGDIFVIDTEAKRSLHYADRFRFRHLSFSAPFSPLDYLQAIEHCQKKGARVIVVDSMSHEHEGPGGVLEMHSRELDRMAGDDWNKREKMNMLAWQKPKAERRRMINTLLQLPISAIFCFRAKEKIKIQKGEKPAPMGYMPIAGEEFVFEMMVNCLLLPRADGVPTWQSDEIGERATMKLPAQFTSLFARREALCEDHGEALAKWAEGDGEDPRLEAMLQEIASVPDSELDALGARIKAERMSRSDKARLSAAMQERRAAIAAVLSPAAEAQAPTAEPTL